MASFSAACRALGRGFVASCVTVAVMLTGTNAHGQTVYYWDTNGNTTGFGTASGTWGASSFFSTNASGTVATSLVTTTLSDDLNFGTATASMGLATGTVAVSGSQSVRSLVFGSQSGTLTLSGGTIGLASSGTITAGQTTNTNTIDSILAGAATGLVKNGAGIVILTQANTYSGSTGVTAGTLTLGGANGSILSSSNIGITTATLTLDNATSNNNDRLGSSATVALNANSTFVFNGNGATASTTESFGTLGFAAGQATVTLANTGAGQLQTLSATSVSRVAGAVGLIRGSSLQTASTNATRLTIGGTAGTGLSFVGSGTSAVGSGTAGTDKTLRIVPYLVGDTSATGNGSSFLTYDTHATAFGLRPLATGEYTTLSTGYTTPATVENVNAFNGTISTASPAVNSLRFNSANQTLNGSGTLTINSGAILATANTTAIGSGFASISLGNGTWNEGVIQVASGNTFAVNAPIAVTGGGGLTKGLSGNLTLNAANTYSGDTVVNGGLLTLGTSGLLGNGNYSGAVQAVGAATLVFNNSGSQTMSGLVSSGSTIQVTGSGSTTFSGGLTSTGLLTLNAPGAVSISGGLTTSAGVTVGSNAGTATISGPWTNIGGISVAGGKTLGFSDGTVTATSGVVGVSGGGVFNFMSGTLNAANDAQNSVTGATTFNQSGGLVSFINAAAGTQNGLRLGSNNSASYMITGGTLDTSANSGAIVVAYNQNATVLSSTLTINGATAKVIARNGSGGGAVTVGWSGAGGGGTINLAEGEIQLGSINTYASNAGVAIINLGGTSGSITLRPYSGNLSLGGGVNTTYTLMGNNALISSSDQNGTARTVTLGLPLGESNGRQGIEFSGLGTSNLNAANTYSGTTRLTSGTLALGNVDALQNSTLNVGSTITFTVAGTNTYSVGGLAGSTGVSIGSNTLRVGTNNDSTTYSGVIAGSSIAAFSKLGSGTLALTGASTLTGTLTAGEGVVSVTTIGGTAAANPLGQGTVGLGTGTTVGTLRYTGAGETSARQFVLSGSAGGGGAIEANGTGALRLLRAGAVVASGSGSKTFTLAGTSLADNEIGVIANPSSGTTSLVKAGSGRWVLSGSNTFSGDVSVNEGQLVLGLSAEGNNGSLGTYSNAAITIGSAAGSGTAALLFKSGVFVGDRKLTIPQITSGSQAVVIGAVDGSGTATFGTGLVPEIALGRDVTLQAAANGTMVFSNAWSQASGTSVSVTIGSADNDGTVVIGQPLAATGSVRIDRGTLRLTALNSSTGSLASAANVVVGTAGSVNTVLDLAQTGSSAAYVFGSNQTLSGIGTIQLDTNTPVSIAGVFRPGNSPGIFTFQGDGSGGLTTLSGTTFMEITGTTVGTTYDQVKFTSGAALNYGGSLLLDISGIYADNTAFQLFDFASTSQTGSFTTISGSGSYGLLTFVRGTNGVWTSGSTSQPNQTFTFTESTGTLVVVPEPATLALAAIGVGLAGWAAVRRRK